MTVFTSCHTGGDIIFDGEHFQGIPRRAITIAVWVKLATALGIQSIFDTVGSHSRHRDGQYHFEIDDGRVRWFHRNEERETVFSVVTDQIVVREGSWTLITGTYSADKNRARVSAHACKYCIIRSILLNFRCKLVYAIKVSMIKAFDQV